MAQTPITTPTGATAGLKLMIHIDHSVGSDRQVRDMGERYRKGPLTAHVYGKKIKPKSYKQDASRNIDS
jgi:hypothetical protein